MSEITAASIPGYATGTWQIDPAHSSVTFSIRHLVSKFRGQFTDFSATLTTADNPTDSSVKATIQTASISTGNPDRDGHLKTPDFFDVENNLTIEFVSTGVRVDGDDWAIDGELTLLGVTKPVTLEADFGGITTDGYGRTVAGFEAETKIKREDFGLTWNTALETGGVLLGPEVKINIEAEFTLDK